MQWMFMVAGFCLGLLVDNIMLGTLLGLLVGQTIALAQVREENKALRKDLDHLGSRVTQLQQAGVPPLPAKQPLPPSVAAPTTATASNTPGHDLYTSDAVAPHPSEAPATTPVAQVAPIQPVAPVTPPVTEPWNAAPSPAPLPEPEAVPILSTSSTQRNETLTTHTTPEVKRPSMTTPSVSPDELHRMASRILESSWIENSLASAKKWLFGGNTVLRIGVLLLFIGLAFLLRYASERVAVPVEFRYAGVAAAAIALLGIGWRLREKRRSYGLILQGTGIAVLYLTVFAAIRLHPLLPPMAALALMVLVTIGLAILAVMQNAVSMAVAAVLGGFAAPILTSSGSGNHVALFSYFALLNAGIFVIAWYKAWRLLNLVGFVGTFGIGLAWGLRAYQPALFYSTEPFLILFFLMYVGIGLLFARRKLRDIQESAPEERLALLRWSARKADYIDATVLFGPPVIGFGLQCGLIAHIEYGMAFSALALGLFYMVMATLVRRSHSARSTSLLMEVYLALGVIFGTLAIPLALDARWTSAAWAVEGAGLYWLGLRQQRRVARLFALFLQAVAATIFLTQLSPGSNTILNGQPLGALLLGAAFLFSFMQLRRAKVAQLADLELLWLPALASTGLGFLYLIAPLMLGVNYTAIAWAVAGLITLMAGLRLQSRSFMFCALGIQALAALLFLQNLKPAGGDTAVLMAGWSGLIHAMLIGAALIASMVIAVRDPMVSNAPKILQGLNVCLLLGLSFINLAALFVLPWRTTSAVWACSGLLILWLGLQLKLRSAFYFGLAIQLAGGLAFIDNSATWLLPSFSNSGLRPLAHAAFWTPALLSLAALTGAWRLHTLHVHKPDMNLPLLTLSRLLLGWGIGWWIFAAGSEIIRFASAESRSSIGVLVTALSVALWAWLARREQWRSLSTACLLLAPCSALILAAALLSHINYHPIAHWGWLAWPLLFAVHLSSLHALAKWIPGTLLSVAHILGCWLLLSVLALELRYLFALLADQYNAWRWLGWALVPSTYLLLISSGRSLPWPVKAYPREYQFDAAAPVAILLLAWFWLANSLSTGAAQPLPYLPIANPLEIGLLTALFALYRWSLCFVYRKGSTGQHEMPKLLQAVFGASLLILLTMAVCRFAHHTFDVPFTSASLGQSMLVQAGLSLVWTLAALGLMVAGTRLLRRDLWFAGGALVGIVVVKMFFIELSNSGSLERIISFIGVGILLLVVGYFSPLPPRRQTTDLESPPA